MSWHMFGEEFLYPCMVLTSRRQIILALYYDVLYHRVNSRSNRRFTEVT